ncbi:MAG: glutathione peroxidase [Candidatus Marinimicrobia bacterium]|nr:glutathione peroxidase [Candidatus Neomarinimicrobiota bacterium]MDP6965669.1 glutathione peroxidase [Candidatus Neomarinimicrobiota bacterium]
MYRISVRGLVVTLMLATPFVLLRAMFTSRVLSPDENVSPKTSIYEYSANLIDGKEISLEQFKGKKMLFVNVASKCGYTPQYKGLQKLHEELGDKVAILGFPANNFFRQEPGTNEEIFEFCSLKYSVTFTMFAKISVKGKDKHPIYQWLTHPKLNGWNDQDPTWNFCKYLVDEEGKLVKFYKSGVKPLSEEMRSDILK